MRSLWTRWWLPRPVLLHLLTFNREQAASIKHRGKPNKKINVLLGLFSSLISWENTRFTTKNITCPDRSPSRSHPPQTPKQPRKQPSKNPLLKWAPHFSNTWRRVGAFRLREGGNCVMEVISVTIPFFLAVFWKLYKDVSLNRLIESYFLRNQVRRIRLVHSIVLLSITAWFNSLVWVGANASGKSAFVNWYKTTTDTDCYQ